MTLESVILETFLADPSRYTEWSTWTCNTRCFNPYARSGTSQKRTRRCIDDTPVKHPTRNCEVMQLLSEKTEPCTLDPERKLTWSQIQKTNVARFADAALGLCPVRWWRKKCTFFALNSVKGLVIHQIWWHIQHWIFYWIQWPQMKWQKGNSFSDDFIIEFGEQFLVTFSSHQWWKWGRV